MFGYIRPRIDELKVRQAAEYPAAYCGLCRCLGKRCGMSSRFLVNYDITFLYLLLSGQGEREQAGRCFCPANPLKKKACAPMSPAMEYSADVCVILCALSLRDKVRDAKGTFIISPNTDTGVIKETKRLGLISIPGFFTASEGFAALKAGADFLKLFPACLGPSYVKDLKAVIKAPILAVGGVNAENIPDFMKVCAGVGIGSALYKPGKTPEQLEKDARAVVAALRS